MKTDSSKILVLEDLVKYYGSGESLVRAVDHTSLEIERGKFTAIVGRSGSGCLSLSLATMVPASLRSCI